MAFVSVPKDLTKVKNKIIFNLTKRQLICFGIAAAVGLPFYFLSRGIIGSSNAATGMCLLMLPAFLFAMYIDIRLVNKDDFLYSFLIFLFSLLNIVIIRFLIFFEICLIHINTFDSYQFSIIQRCSFNKFNAFSF